MMIMGWSSSVGEQSSKEKGGGGEHLGSKGPRTRLWAHIVGLFCIDGLYTSQSTRQTYFTPPYIHRS